MDDMNDDDDLLLSLADMETPSAPPVIPGNVDVTGTLGGTTMRVFSTRDDIRVTVTDETGMVTAKLSPNDIALLVHMLEAAQVVARRRRLGGTW